MTLEVSTLDARVLKALVETIAQKVTALFFVEFVYIIHQVFTYFDAFSKKHILDILDRLQKCGNLIAKSFCPKEYNFECECDKGFTGPRFVVSILLYSIFARNSRILGAQGIVNIKKTSVTVFWALAQRFTSHAHHNSCVTSEKEP